MSLKGPNLNVFEEDLKKRLAGAVDSVQDGEVEIRDITPNLEHDEDWKKVFNKFSEVYAFVNGIPDIAYLVGKDSKVYELRQHGNPFELRVLTEGQELERIELHPLTILDSGHVYIQMNAEFRKEFPIIYHGRRKALKEIKS